MRTHSLLFMLMLTMAVNSQTPDANTILDKVDENMSAQTQIMTATMEIYSARATRTMEMKIWTEGDRKSFTEYLAPAREKARRCSNLTSSFGYIHLQLTAPFKFLGTCCANRLWEVI